MNHPSNILVVYHSQTGNCQKIFESVCQGVALETPNMIAKHAHSATLDDVLNSQGLFICSPENFGTLCGLIKDFLERVYYPIQTHQHSMAYAGIITAETNGHGAAHQLLGIAQGMAMRLALPCEVFKLPIGTSELEKAKNLGQTFAAGLNMGIF